MSNNHAARAIEAARPTFERLLNVTFEQLDALTSEVEIRRQFYAQLILRTARKADERLPDSHAIRDTIETLCATLYPDRAYAKSPKGGRSCPA